MGLGKVFISKEKAPLVREAFHFRSVLIVTDGVKLTRQSLETKDLVCYVSVMGELGEWGT
jgi:hypothetical protein